MYDGFSIRLDGLKIRPTMDSLSVTHFAAQLRHVPNLHGLIAASRDQEPAVGAERQAGDDAHVTAEVADQRARVAVPDFHGAVFTPRGDPPAVLVGAESDGIDFSVMSLEGLKLPACLDVPDFDRVLLTSRGQPLAIRAEGHVHTRSGDPRLEGAVSYLNLIEPLRVPDLHNSVTAGRGEPPSVGAEDQSLDIPLVRTELVDLPAGLGIPDFHAPIPFSRDQVLAVAAERHSEVGLAWTGLEFGKNFLS